MEEKIRDVGGLLVNYSKSSIQVFPAIRRLKDSSELYLKFSNNHTRTLALQLHAELSLDFDLCLIDRAMNETILQLFAIFTVTHNGEPMNQWHYVETAIAFARTLLVEEIEGQGWEDRTGHLIQVPALQVKPESNDFNF